MAYLVLNPKNLDADIQAIKNHVEQKGPVIFSEVTNRKVTNNFTDNEHCYFIDPQHTFSGEGGNLKETESCSAILYCLIYKNKIEKFLKYPKHKNKETLYILEKPDMDSVGAVVLSSWFANLESYDWNVAYNRINDIHNVDCWIQPTEWSPDWVNNYQVNWTNILGAAISDWKQPIETRVGYMTDFLLDGSLPEFYKESVIRERELLDQSTVETLSGITVVSSAARGVSGAIYKHAPYGIAFTNNFMGKGAKYTIMEFQGGKYLDLAGFFTHMNTHYPSEYGTFGGNIKAGIGGSYVPCALSKETVAAELAKFIITTPVVSYQESNIC